MIHDINDFKTFIQSSEMSGLWREVWIFFSDLWVCLSFVSLGIGYLEVKMLSIQNIKVI